MSTVSLLPPKNQGLLGSVGGLSALLKEVAPGAAGKLGSQSSAYSYLAILKSRRAAESIIRKFGLIEEYGIEDNSIEKGLKEFDSNYSVEVSEEGAIVISILDKDSVRAAQMTSYMVDVLNEVSIELGSGEARSNREFLEKRVAETRAELSLAEDGLKKFQEVHGMIFLPEDAKAIASSIGSLYARKVRADIELAILSKTAGEGNPAYKQLDVEQKELEKKLSTFPNLGMESFRLYRDVLIQQKILELLVPLYEQARIEEQKDMPVMLVLDKPVPAEKKSRPKRMLIVASAFVSSLIIAIMLVMVLVRFQIFKADPAGRYHDLLYLLRWKNSSKAPNS